MCPTEYYVTVLFNVYLGLVSVEVGVGGLLKTYQITSPYLHWRFGEINHEIFFCIFTMNESSIKLESPNILLSVNEG